MAERERARLRDRVLDLYLGHPRHRPLRCSRRHLSRGARQAEAWHRPGHLAPSAHLARRHRRLRRSSPRRRRAQPGRAPNPLLGSRWAELFAGNTAAALTTQLLGSLARSRSTGRSPNGPGGSSTGPECGCRTCAETCDSARAAQPGVGLGTPQTSEDVDEACASELCACDGTSVCSGGGVDLPADTVGSLKRQQEPPNWSSVIVKRWSTSLGVETHDQLAKPPLPVDGHRDSERRETLHLDAERGFAQQLQRVLRGDIGPGGGQPTLPDDEGPRAETGLRMSRDGMEASTRRTRSPRNPNGARGSGSCWPWIRVLIHLTVGGGGGGRVRLPAPPPEP